MAYELEIVMPVVTSIPLYRRRLKDFKSVGLLKFPVDTKIKLVLLIKKPMPFDIAKGWPRGCDVVVNEYETDAHVCKLCQYYLDMKVFDSKWYVSLDDDSVTNIEGLLTSLAKYDNNEELYFSTLLHYEERPHDPTDLRLLKELNLLHFLNKNWDHDFESHFITRSTLLKILDNSMCRKYIYERSKIADGFLDKFISYAARIAAINLINAPFSSPYPDIEEFSLFKRGYFHHIHGVARDLGNNISIFKTWKNLKCSVKDYNKFVNREFDFISKINGLSREMGKIKLMADNVVGGDNSSNDFFWVIKKNRLCFISKDGVVNTEFHYANDRLVGNSLLNPGAQSHLLSAD